MTSEFIPRSEDGSNEKGEMLYDAESLQQIGHFEDPCFNKHIEKSEISDFGDEAFLSHNLMSPGECDHYIQSGEKAGFRELQHASHEYRSCQRIIFKSSELASTLWKRVHGLLRNITIDGDPSVQHVFGAKCLLQGTWEPYCLNEVFRLVRYHPGGHFAPHFDGYFVESSEVRSLKTLMLYLNGDFSGGSTNFVDEKQILYKDTDGKYCAEENNILCRIQPESGMGIIFNHHRLHEGQRLSDGVKYILRTDIMYKNINKPAMTDDEERAIHLLQEAERKEAAGDCMEAVELYRKAFKLNPTLETTGY